MGNGEGRKQSLEENILVLISLTQSIASLAPAALGTVVLIEHLVLHQLLWELYFLK